MAAYSKMAGALQLLHENQLRSILDSAVKNVETVSVQLT